MPPSADITRLGKKNPNRIQSGKKPGGQSGHKGTFLKMREHTDEIVPHSPQVCNSCGLNLGDVIEKEFSRGQIIDIPIIKTRVTEHISYVKQCPCCQAVNKTSLPGTLDYCNVQYGPNIRNLIVFLSARHFVPIKRIQELIYALTGERVSTGFINNCIYQKSQDASPVYDQILEQIIATNCVHSDETGFKVKNLKYWMWYWGTEIWKYFEVSAQRGYNTITNVLGDAYHDFVLVSDRWAAQLKTNCKGHQLCLVHLIRDCNKLIEQYNSKWAGKLKKIFEEIINIKSKGEKITKRTITSIEDKLATLLENQLLKSHDKIITFRHQLKKQRKYLTTCLRYHDVPAHNNQAERSIRNVKLKTKISTNFRSEEGAKNYAVIRSIIDSAIAKGLNVFDVLRNPNLLFN